MSEYWINMNFTEEFFTLIDQLKSGPELPENSVFY
ncbi:hypothetical protein MCGE09_00577 [Thaumarchaeota archaeon SCGC AB-539-E09]|nr:hypothetical protein MCGE09_00577 [Thaumarchaeota archaeon SCGC AB-539-E09]